MQARSPEKHMLTKKQRDMLTLIIHHVEEYGIAPSFEELCAAAGLKSKSGIHRIMSALEERGYIARLHNRARAVDILRHPDGSAYVQSAAMASIPDASLAPAPDNTTTVIDIPLLGKIAAGTPIAAISDQSNTMPIPEHMLGRGEYFALIIEGDSMIDAGIMDGDTVIIEKGDTAQNGDIVVALLEEDDEATLKRLRRKSYSIALEPANSKYETRIFGPDQVKIQGTLKGLIRQY
jgi:repressor LexA